MATPPINRTTPGVYINEIDAFPPSIVGVATAVPAFIGYTQKAIAGGKPAFLQPVAITSLADYETAFGAGFRPIYNIVEVSPKSASPGAPPDLWDFQVGSSYYQLQPIGGSPFNLYNSVRLFFLNGGGNCYVVSVGDYTNHGQSPNGVKVNEADLLNGIKAIHGQAGPTMLVIPDAVLLPPTDLSDPTVSGAFANVTQAMLAQCGELQDRVAILDVYGAQTINPGNVATALDPLVANFQTSVGSNSLSYGMAYFPLLNTAVAQAGEVDYTNFNPQQSAGVVTSPAGGTMLQYLLEEVADTLYAPGSAQRATVQQWINEITVVVPDPNDPGNPQVQQKITALNQNLSNALPPYMQWQNIVLQKLNLLPPSGGMAGIFTFSDQSRGVWNAPANLSMASVTSSSLNLTDTQQATLNLPLNGKAIDVIRYFAGRGPVVWGARTLDGNSNDWRYIQIRREIIYIEQSIKQALNQFVFAPNDGQTWATVTAMISNFLTALWQQGGLLGSKASDAFTVLCGVGSTMTAQDILNGYMIVQVTLQMIHPAEFIELTFKQQMLGS